MLDILDAELPLGGVGAAAVDGADALEALPEGLAQGDVHDAVQPDFVLHLGEDAAADEQPLLVQDVLGKRQGQTENRALLIAPNYFHIGISLFSFFLLYHPLRRFQGGFYPGFDKQEVQRVY